jgi:hypothetical protein
MRDTRRPRLRSPVQLWGRRTVLAGLALVALAVFGALILAVDDGDGGDRQPVPEATTQPPAVEAESLEDASSGISVSWPSDWNKLEKGGVLAFRSPDGTVLVGISAPADAGEAEELRKGAIASAADEYKNPVIRHGKGRKIGGLPATGATISERGSGGRSVTLVAVAPGKRNAYLFETVKAANAPSERLIEAQLILNSLKLTK